MSKTILIVQGLSCPSCVEHVHDALAMQGVGHIDVQLDEGVVAVDHDSSVSVGQLIAALQDAGYDGRRRDQVGHA